MKILINKKVIPKSLRRFIYNRIRKIIRLKRKFHEIFSKKYAHKIIIAQEANITYAVSNNIEKFSSNLPNFYYYGIKPYWLEFKNLKLRKLGYYFLNTEVIGKGIQLNNFGEVILESTISQKLYLDKLNSYHLIVFKKIMPFKKLKNAICLSNQLEDNYFHWFMESIGRLVFIPNEILKLNTIIIKEKPCSFQKESLIELFNVPESNILLKNKFTRLKIQNSLISTNPVTIKKNTNIYNPYVIKKINSIALSKASEVSEQNIIISRKGASQRRIVNDTVLLEKFKWLNFKIVYLENLSVRDQINLFSNSNLIIATHGAGLTNLLFCKNPLIIEFFPNNRLKRDSFYFYQISKSLNFRHHIIEYEAINTSQDLRLGDNEIEKLKNILSEFS